MNIKDSFVVIDDFLGEFEQKIFEMTFNNLQFNWTYNPSSLYVDNLLDNESNNNDFQQTEDVLDTALFTNMFFLEGITYSDQYKSLIENLILSKLPIEITKLIRIKINLTLPQYNLNSYKYNPIHVDSRQEENSFSMVYYINDTDGDTILFNEKKDYKGPLTEKGRVSPKKGRLVIFDGDLLHGAGIPTKNARMIINCNALYK